MGKNVCCEKYLHFKCEGLLFTWPLSLAQMLEMSSGYALWLSAAPCPPKSLAVRDMLRHQRVCVLKWTRQAQLAETTTNRWSPCVCPIFVCECACVAHWYLYVLYCLKYILIIALAMNRMQTHIYSRYVNTLRLKVVLHLKFTEYLGSNVAHKDSLVTDNGESIIFTITGCCHRK